MKNIRIPLILVLAMTVSSCGIFGDDGDSTGLSTSENFTPEPTTNVVVPVDDGGSDAMADETEGGTTTDEATSALPTAVTIPATAVPPEPTPDRSQPITYVVESGDVLGLIAEEFDVDIAELRRVNNLSGNLIRVGQTLTIPPIGGGDSTTPTTDDSDDGDETASGVIGSTTPSSPSTPAATPTPVSCGSNAVGHCVQSGDSLLGIASKYGVSVDALRAANPSISGDTILIGDLITIPGQSGGSSGGSDTPSTGATVAPTTTTVAAPLNDADCAARNPEFPYFHASDGLCYANPIGATAVPTAVGTTPNETCPEGTFLWEDGLCYPIPGVSPTPAPTQAPSTINADYGTAPCEEPYFIANSAGKCFLTNEGVEAGFGGAGTPAPTSTG